MTDQSAPIELFSKSADPSSGSSHALVLFSSYSFDKNILIPSSPFRFTAENVDAKLQQSIRSGDLVELFVKNPAGNSIQIGAGIVDETDSHTCATADEYLITGRDMLGQLVDNSAIDSQNRIVHLKDTTILGLTKHLIENTRISSVLPSNLPNGKVLFQTNPGETKITALQRYLEYANCLVWCASNGQLKVGKPNMAQNSMGSLILKKTDPSQNNLLDIRVRRSTNQAIQKIAVQLQNLEKTDTDSVTVFNSDPDVRSRIGSRVARSVYRLFGLGNSQEVVNSLILTGNGGAPQDVGRALARREIARENMKVLDVECVVRGHINDSGLPYDIDQVYRVTYEKESIDAEMYVYAVRYDLTIDRGMTTTLRLCKIGSLVADVPARKS